MLVILALFAMVPSIVLTVGWSGLAARMLPLMSGIGAWEQVAESGDSAIRAVRTDPSSPAAAAALRAHEQALGESRVQARRFSFLSQRAAVLVAVVGLFLLALLAVTASSFLVTPTG